MLWSSEEETRVEVCESSPGIVRIEGALTFGSCSQALSKSAPYLKGSGLMTFDLAGVDRVDSAGLALLIEWQRVASKSGSRLRYVSYPDQLVAIARVVGVDEMFSIFSGSQ